MYLATFNLFLLNRFLTVFNIFSYGVSFTTSFTDCQRLSLSTKQSSVAHGHALRPTTWSRSLSIRNENGGDNIIQSGPQIVCIGEVLLDCIATEDAMGLSVDELLSCKSWKEYPGGAVANVASACCKLGTKSAFLGCVGDDEGGKNLVQLLNNIGVDTTLVQTTNRYPTRQVIVTRSLQGDRSFGAFLDKKMPHEFADCYYLLDESNLSSDRFSQLQKLLQNSNWMVCGTLGLAFPTFSNTMKFLLNLIKNEEKINVFVDVNWRPVFWEPFIDAQIARKVIMDFCQNYATIVKLTDEEAEWLVGGTLEMDSESILSNPSLLHQFCFPNAVAVLVTAGEKGASYSVQYNSDPPILTTSAMVSHITGYIGPTISSHQVIETTGAGDAFSAGFLHALLQQPSSSLFYDVIFNKQTLSDPKPVKVIMDDIVRFACAAGALTCTQPGAIAAQPTLDELKSFLASLPLPSLSNAEIS